MLASTPPRHTLRLVRCAEWRRHYARCVEQLHLHWTLDAYDNADPGAWIKETRKLLNRVRIAIRGEQKRMQRSHRTHSRPTLQLGSSHAG